MLSKADVLMSSSDVRVLQGLLADPNFSAESEESSPDLWAKILDASVVRPHALPSDIVRLHSTVTYEELPARKTRTVTLVTPRDADPSKGRISVLSPVGRALLGHPKGRVIRVALPIGRNSSVRLLEVVSAEVEKMEEPISA